MFVIHILNHLFQFLFPRPFSLETLLLLPRNTAVRGSEFFSLWSYQHQTVKTVVRYLKNNHDEEVGRCIATIIVEELKSFCFSGSIGVVAVPVSPTTYRTRGFNQVSHVARSIAHQLRAEYVHVHKRETAKQSLLNRKQRFENIHSAFYADPSLSFNQYQTVIIVDDLITTGATYTALKRFVVERGAKSVTGVSIAH